MPVPTNLPAGAKEIFRKAEAGAKKSTCKDAGERQDECVARVAWSAVKKKYKKVGDKWVRKADLVEFDLYISKASYDKATGEMLWSAVASDTKEDDFGDEMSLELFSDFVARIEKDEEAPDIVKSDFWSGGMPYLSISHYSDQNGKGVPGDVRSVYVDGERLKAKGIFHDTELGRACFRAICEDLYSENRSYDKPVRISIGFIDWKHKHKDGEFLFSRNSLSDKCPQCKNGNGGKIFLEGQLVHLALTRVPVNTRTEILTELSMADEIKTRLDDAKSIVGEEADELEENELVGRSELVVKSKDVIEEEADHGHMEEDEEDEEEEEEDEEKEKKSKAGPITREDLVSIIRSEIKQANQESTMAKDEHPLEPAFQRFSKAYDELPDGNPQEKLQAIQPHFNKFAEEVRRAVEGEAPLNGQVEGVLGEMAGVLSSLNENVALLNQQLQGSQQRSQVPQRRSVDPSLVSRSGMPQTNQQPQRNISPLSQQINRSVGLPQEHQRQGALYKE